MAQTIRDVMTPDPIMRAAGFPLADAARRMRERNIGDVLVLDGTEVCGVVTDRDIVVRAVAEDRDPKTTKLGDICSRDLVTVSADDSAEAALELMRAHALRRLPVVDRGTPVGIVSIGDLASGQEAGSALSGISRAAPNS